MIWQAVMAFNLICSGTSTRFNPDEGEIRTNFTLVIRVDLESSRWCHSDCEETIPIANVTATTIQFQDFRSGDLPITISQSVNRESGNYQMVLRAVDGGVVRSGRCERAPFTGFPARRF